MPGSLRKEKEKGKQKVESGKWKILLKGKQNKKKSKAKHNETQSIMGQKTITGLYKWEQQSGRSESSLF